MNEAKKIQTLKDGYLRAIESHARDLAMSEISVTVQAKHMMSAIVNQIESLQDLHAVVMRLSDDLSSAKDDIE